MPKVDDLPILVFWFSEPAFSAGVKQVRIDDVPVRVYSAAKTLADCFKYRHKIGLDVAVEALRRFRERKGKSDLQELVRFARICRVQRIHAPLSGGHTVSKRDLAASVRQRLLNQAREQGRPFQELLQYYVMERLL